MKPQFQNLFKYYCILAICSQQFFAKANTDCATQFTANQANYIIETQAQRDSINVADVINNNIIEIPVAVHILEADSVSTNEDQVQTLTVEQVDQALENLNIGFSQSGFHFNLCSINEIPYSASLNEINYSIYDNSNEFIMAKTSLAPRALNIYFVPKTKTPNGESVCGWASFPAEYYNSGKNWIVIRNDCANNGSTLIHEVGHFFNLYHTHQKKNIHLGITTAELADESNCGPTVGDGLCDTPAEPYRAGKGIFGIVNEDCEILCEHIDANGEAYNLGYTIDGETKYNYMSYAPYKCRSRFTDDQIERMKKSYLIDRNYLSNICSREISTICDPLKDKKALYKLYSSLGGPIPGSWHGVTFNNDSCVTAIDLPNASLTGEIPIEIDDLNYLSILNLSSNNICGTLPPSIGNLQQLNTLNLSNNQITGKIPDEIYGLSKLLSLDLSYNKLSDYIPYHIAELDSLQELKLSGNDFTGCLHLDLSNFINQENLEIDNFQTVLQPCNKCNENDWLALKSIYQNFQGAKWMLLFSGQIATELFTNDSPPTDCNLDSLGFLSLNEYDRVEMIKMQGANLSEPLPDEISLLTDIKGLVLNYNNITDTLPESISDLKKLQFLSLKGNPIADCFPIKLTELCGKALIGANGNDLWNDFCEGKGGYCEDVADYVMPGDFNNDKKVNNIDLIYWRQARALADTIGSPRENAHIAWLPQYSEDWDGDIWGVNRKHFDTNGDSIICKADLKAFYQNYGKGTTFVGSDNADQNSGDGLPTTESQFTLEYTSDGTTGFHLKLKNVPMDENILTLIFTINLGSLSYQNAYFDYAGVDNKPTFENIQRIDGKNEIEIALVWNETNPPPIDDPFGRIFIVAEDNGNDGGSAGFRISNINILGNNVFSSSDVLDIAFDNGDSFENSGCAFEFMINENLSGNYTYNAEQKITSEAYINGCTNMTFKAGESIELNSGFKTQHGVVFCAEIPAEPCVAPSNRLNNNIEMGLHPNPAKNQATLTFELIEASTVNLSLNDITGKPLKALLNNANKETGLHQIAIDTSHLPVGIYYCTLKNKETVSTQKLLVVK